MNDNHKSSDLSPLYQDDQVLTGDGGPGVNNSRSNGEEHQSSIAAPAVAPSASTTTASREQPDSKNQNNDPSSLDVAEEWSGNATIHGVHYVMDRSHLKPWRRRIWLVIMLTMAGILIWQIDVLVSAYLKYETNTNFRIEVPRSLPFPEVTICNMHSIQTSRVIESGHDGPPVDEDELLAISQPLEDFLIVYFFNNVEGDRDLWTPVVTTDGLCFRFRTEETIVRPGLEGGLLVSLFVNTSEYYDDGSLDILSGAAGVQIFIAQEGTTEVRQVPFDLGAPGTLQYIGISRSILKRETRKPWSQCNGRAPEFTLPKCREECFEYLVREVCGCREYSDTSDTSLSFCPDYEACYQLIDGDENRQCEELDCSQPPCYEEVYKTRSSALELLPNQTDKETAETVTVLINYEAIRQEVVVEVRAQSFSQLLGSLGGQMGLFMGISVISLIEFFGELLPLRLLPRLWGDRRLYGLGSKEG